MCGLCVCVRAHMDVDLDIHTCVLLYSGKIFKTFNFED